nr:hypothetical protein [Kibdelosporangium sp. MJ126-NF4]
MASPCRELGRKVDAGHVSAAVLAYASPAVMEQPVHFPRPD